MNMTGASEKKEEREWNQNEEGESPKPREMTARGHHERVLRTSGQPKGGMGNTSCKVVLLGCFRKLSMRSLPRR